MRYLAVIAVLCSAFSGSLLADWSEVPGILERIQAPTFPDRDYVITEYGAKADGSTEATEAIRAAIEACHADGGGRVVVPPGEFLTGAIHLRDGVNLHVSAGATLRFGTKEDLYLPPVFTRWEGVECMNYSALIYAIDGENLAITGEGTLDGGASLENWWDYTKRGTRLPVSRESRDRLFKMAEDGVPPEQRIFGKGHWLRPNFVQFYRCRNILIEGVTFIRSPMWVVHPVLCRNVTVRGIEVISHGPNNDGCNPESSQDVLIENCVFDTGDDCIAIKSGRNADGRRVNVASENIIIRGCRMKDGHGGVVLGSEITGGCRNLFVEDCEFDSPNLQWALRLKSNASRGGVIEDLYMRNCTVGRVSRSVFIIDFDYEEGAVGDFPPVVRNVLLENIFSASSHQSVVVRTFPGAVVENVVLRDCIFESVEKPDPSSRQWLTLENVQIQYLTWWQKLRNRLFGPADL